MDVNIYDNGNGGDVYLKGNNIQLSQAIYNHIYLALFGGNIEASTVQGDDQPDQRFDWWANQVVFQDRPELQYNSDTERTLKSVALNSAGRLTIEQVVKKDLDFLKEIGTVSTEVSIIGNNKISIFVQVLEPSNTEPLDYRFIWDATRQEVIDEINI